jgi:hypothetical protein
MQPKRIATIALTDRVAVCRLSRQPKDTTAMLALISLLVAHG